MRRISTIVPFIQFSFLALIIFAVVSANPCLAQDAFSGQLDSHPGSPSPQTQAPILPAATNGTIGPPTPYNGPVQTPTSPGAYNGPRLQGVMTAGTVRVNPNIFQENPAVIFAVPVVAFGLFLLLRRKRASVWEMGAVAAVILTLS